MKAEIRTITPDEARRLLAKNKGNRPISESHVALFAGEILKGRWALNGSSIVLNGDRLIDGQHRLHAIIRANKPIQTVIVEGVSSDVFDTIDVGKKRKTADVLAIRGEKASLALAATCSLVLRVENGVMSHRGGNTFTTLDIEDCLRRHPRIRESLHKAILYKQLCAASMMAMVHYFGSRLDEDAADEFLRQVGTGIGLNAGDPAYVLREKLLANRTSMKKFDTPMLCAFYIKAWNAYREGRQIALLKMKDGEDYPVIR